MTLINRKRRVYIRYMRKSAQRSVRDMKGVRAKIILHDDNGVNLLKSRFVRGRFVLKSLKFNA